MKNCNKCMRPDMEYYSSNKNTCKECIKSRVKQNRANNIEHYREFDRLRGKLEHRVQARKEYRGTEEYRKRHADANKRYAQKYPLRDIARTMLRNAVRDGKVTPWPKCALPCCDGKREAHHPDYDRPLEVVWLCDRHHKDAHNLTRKHKQGI